MENSIKLDVWVELKKNNIPTKVEEIFKIHLDGTSKCRNIPGLGYYFFTYENEESYFMKIGAIWQDEPSINVYTDGNIDIDYYIYLEEHLVLPTVDELTAYIKTNNFKPVTQPIKFSEAIILNERKDGYESLSFLPQVFLVNNQH